MASYAAVGILVFGYFFAAPLATDTWNAYQSTSWPKTSGRVTHSEVQHGRRGGLYAAISYSYVVQGNVYQSNRMQFFRSAQDESGVRELAAQYPVGRTLPVFFKPSQPSEAVLIPGLASTKPLLMLAFGTLAVALATALLLRPMIRVRRPGGSGSAAL